MFICLSIHVSAFTIEQVGSSINTSDFYLRGAGSNFGQDTDYPDGFFVVFLSPSRKMLG
jgi:hypothetical protein